jgi:hypothetical protein
MTEDRETVIAARKRVRPIKDAAHWQREADDWLSGCDPFMFNGDAFRLVAEASRLLALVDAREQQDEEHDQTASR